MSSILDLGLGIFVLSPADGASNVSIIRQGSQALIIDAGPLPSQTREFQKRLTEPEDERLLVLTHHHADHIFGADGADASRVITHVRAAGLLAERGESEREHLARALPDAADELKTAAVPQVATTVSTATALELGDRQIQLLPVGPAHTPGDLVVFDTRSETLFTGDVAFNGLVPVLRDADSGGWIAALQSLLALDPKVVVPGHGAVSDASCLHDMIELLSAMRDIVTRRQAEDEPTISPDDLPVRFHNLRRPERLALAAKVIAAELSAESLPN